MADIVIRGYKMPCNCGGCEFFLENSLGAKWCEIKFTPTEEAGRPSWCPLIALPEGHGRLIDADKLMRHYANCLTALLSSKTLSSRQKRRMWNGKDDS